MENLQVSDNETITSSKKGRGQYERKARGSYQKHKLEKKISVKHYLNKRLNYVQESDNLFRYDGVKYALYVQIIFNSKTTVVKSATGLYLSEEEFANQQNEYFYKDLCRELKFIQFHIQNLYQLYSSEIVGIFDCETDKTTYQPEFSKKQVQKNIEHNLLNNYSYYNYEINIIVNSLLRLEVIEYAKKILDKEIEKKDIRSKQEEEVFQIIYEEVFALWHDFYHSNIEYNFNVVDLLNYLEFRSPIFKDIKNIYTSGIWSFGAYYGFLRHDVDYPYNKLGATILDFIEGDFENVFLSKFNSSKEVALKIMQDLKSLVKAHYNNNFN